MKYFLGIDVGSSKTHALIVDETGQCVGFGKHRVAIIRVLVMSG